jgi:hypothetical protein
MCTWGSRSRVGNAARQGHAHVVVRNCTCTRRGDLNHAHACRAHKHTCQPSGCTADTNSLWYMSGSLACDEEQQDEAMTRQTALSEILARLQREGSA